MIKKWVESSVIFRFIFMGGNPTFLVLTLLLNSALNWDINYHLLILCIINQMSRWLLMSSASLFLQTNNLLCLISCAISRFVLIVSFFAVFSVSAA